MAKKSEERTAEGAPGWMVTYGDMMTLLLCFFVIIVAMSETKKDEKFRKVMDAIRQQFGYHAAARAVPGSSPPLNSLLDRLSGAGLPRSQDAGKHGNKTRSLTGKFLRVRTVRDGLKITLGGPVLFKWGHAALSGLAQDELNTMAEILAGKPHKMTIKGHTDCRPLPSGSPYADQWDLGYARAKTVAESLIRKGIDPARISIATSGPFETVKQTRSDVQRALNRRVEIYVTEAYVRDYRGPSKAPGASATDRPVGQDADRGAVAVPLKG